MEAKTAASGPSDYRAPDGTDIGHVHLKVADLDRSIAFYVGVLGFRLTQRYGEQAAFVSAGGRRVAGDDHGAPGPEWIARIRFHRGPFVNKFTISTACGSPRKNITYLVGPSSTGGGLFQL